MLFVGTSSGAVRSVKFPLSDMGEWQEHQAHAASVSRVRGEGGREGGWEGGRNVREGSIDSCDISLPFFLSPDADIL